MPRRGAARRPAYPGNSESPRCARDRPGEPTALGIAARDRRVRRPHLGGARRARASGRGRGAVGLAHRDSRFAQGDSRRRGGSRVDVHGREPAGARDRPAHPAAERAASTPRTDPGGRQPQPRAAVRGRAVRPRPRARAVRAERGVSGAPPLALAERRHLPRAGRDACSRPRSLGMLVEMFFGRIDARTASSETTGELIERFFPGAYELIRPGADVAEPALPPPPAGRIRIVHSAEEERGALRLFLRALRKLPEDLDWEAVIWFDGPTDPLARVSRRMRERLQLVGPRDGAPAEYLAGADIVCPRLRGSAPGPAGRSRGDRGGSRADRLAPRALPGGSRGRRAGADLPRRGHAHPGGPDRAARHRPEAA